MTTLKDLIHDETKTIADIGAWLDAQSAQTRLAESRTLDRNDQRQLYRRAGNAHFSLEHFVPKDVADVTAVHHDGKNTLPLPGKMKFFQKRFCRPDDGSDRLFGYNVSKPNDLIGPGYFVARYTAGNPAWTERAPIVIDYFQVPDGRVPSEWPPVVPNTQGLQRFAISDTRDFMRRVSHHVSIGAAHKVEKPIDHYFILVRKD